MNNLTVKLTCSDKKINNILMKAYDVNDSDMLARGYTFELSNHQTFKFVTRWINSPESEQIVIIRESYDGYMATYATPFKNGYIVHDTNIMYDTENNAKRSAPYFKSYNSLLEHLHSVEGMSPNFRILLVRFDFQTDIEKTAKKIVRKSYRSFNIKWLESANKPYKLPEGIVYSE
jgi:hypothetical protein